MPKSASSNNVRKEYKLDPMENDDMKVEMPKLYQYNDDIDEILAQPVEKPKIQWVVKEWHSDCLVKNPRNREQRITCSMIKKDIDLLRSMMKHL